MLDIGLGEVIVIAIIALLVFGPDRLPKVASDAARTMRQLRAMAVAARKDLSDAAGFEKDEELSQVVRDIRDLDPRRALSGLGDESTGPGAGSGSRPGSNGARRGPGAGAASTGASPAGSAAKPGASGVTGAAAAGAAAASAAAAQAGGSDSAARSDAADGSAPADDVELTAGPVLGAAPADPDWT